MALVAASKSSDFELAPAGTHVGRCYRIIDMGTQYSPFYKKSSHKLRIYWELPNELMKDGKPFSVNKQYTLSLGDKANLRQDLESWRGRKFTPEESQGFDITKVLGAPCMLNVNHDKHDDKEYANVTSVIALPKGMTCPAQVNPSFVFELGAFDQTKFDSLPDFLKDKIKQSTEYQQLFGSSAAPAVPEYESENPAPSDNDIPW